MPKAKLDATFVNLAYCELGKKKTDYWDETTTGFVLEVRSTGGKTYYLRYQDANGRQTAYKIAAVGDLTFERARKEAKRLRSQVVLGGNPAEAKEEKKAIPTYTELSIQHLAHAKTYMRSYDSLETNMRLHLVPRWGSYLLDEITPQLVAQWLFDLSNQNLAPATIEKLRTSLGKSYSLAARWSLPGVGLNPVHGIKGPAFDNRETGRYLSAEEASRLLDAAGHSLNTQLRPIVALLLLTGARLGELLWAKWECIDLERRAWLIPMTKNGSSRYVPLSTAAIGIIALLPKYDKCPWLIPNTETKLPFVSIKHSWQKARRDAHLLGLRLHDLRHSSASIMINNGVDLLTAGKILGHADYKSTMRYSRLANKTLLSAVEAGAAGLNMN